MKTLIIFDIDGTLLHSNKVDSQSFAESYEAQFGKPFPSIDWRNYPHVTDHTIFNDVIMRHFDRKATDEDIRRQQDHFVDLLLKKRNHSPKQFKEVPGAKNTMERLLADEKMVVGIATGGWERPATVKLNHLGFPADRFFSSFADDKITREDIITESVEKARSVHHDIHRLVYIGDAVWDVKTTRNMQMDFVGVRIKGDKEVLINEGADTVVQNYRDYDHFLAAIKRAKPPGMR